MVETSSPGPRRRTPLTSGSRDQAAGEGSSSLRYVAAFRTYAWDEEIAELARRFFAATPSARQVVLVDETRGPIEVPGYEKITHSEQTACPELPNYPRGRSLWFNVDYGIYALQRALPDFDYYLLSESDLSVNLSLEPMMRFAIDQGIDLIAHKVRPSSPSWYWHAHGLALSPDPWQALLFFMVLSRRAIKCLLAERRQQALRLAAGETDLWPFCEAFVPTVLKSAGMRFADVDAFAATHNLDFRPRLSLHDPRASRPGSLAHSVLGGKRFIAALLAQHPPRDFFRPGSELREGLLSQMPFEDMSEPLLRALAAQRDYPGQALLLEEAAANGWPVPEVTDLAFCKPAVSSSVSLYSRSRDPELDARGANDATLRPDYGFHTDREFHPWWMVDLLNPHIVEEIAIVNRPGYARRFSTFAIETSCDGSAWITRYSQDVPGDISMDVQSPWRLRFPERLPVRYLRIILLGCGPLHLRRVQVFGRVLPLRPCAPGLGLEQGWPAGPLTDLAFSKPAVSSSVCRYSRYQDPELDARGANSDSLPNDYGFHTRREVHPWWMVDLGEEHFVEQVAIVNRRSHPERFRAFSIQSSCDGDAWTDRFCQPDAEEISPDAQTPWRASFAPPFPARYLRIVLSGVGTLHLRRVQVLGRIVPGRTSPASGGMRGWPAGPVTDLAFCRPALSSSASHWSRSQDRALDAAGTNGETLPHDYGFHTQHEVNPWWMVDLEGEHLVDEIAIVNRRSQSQRFQTFRIETSLSLNNWTTRLLQTDPVEVSSDAESPWRLSFPVAVPARYVRVTLIGEGMLHLRRVQVWGRIQPARRVTPGPDASALSTPILL